MSDSLESIVGVIQLAVAALLSFYLFQVFSIFPELTTGPFSGVFALLSALPWVFCHTDCSRVSHDDCRGV